jgi:D-alanine-D-alanine ligase
MRIAVLFGGMSEEREVSIASAAQIVPALRQLGHEVFAVDTAAGRMSEADERQVLVASVSTEPPLPVVRGAPSGRTCGRSLAALEVRDAELVFIALHGGAGEDGRIQALLGLAGLAYTGSNHSASAAAMDKDLSKRLFRSVDVPTPDWQLAPVSAEFVSEPLAWPVVVKPNRQGSTVGVSIVRTSQDLPSALRSARQFDTEVMIETFVPGREFTVGVLDGVALPVGEIMTAGEIFDYRAKYQGGGASEVFPAEIGSDVCRLLQDYALRAHTVLKLGAYSRTDFRQDHSGRVWCLEANSLPGMTATSLLPQAARAAGIGFAELVQRICACAIQPQTQSWSWYCSSTTRTN